MVQVEGEKTSRSPQARPVMIREARGPMPSREDPIIEPEHMQSIATRTALRRTPILGALLASSVLLSAQGPLARDTPTAEEIADAGKLFGSSCSMCHLPPDPEHPTDLAWLEQVTDTA